MVAPVQQRAWREPGAGEGPSATWGSVSTPPAPRCHVPSCTSLHAHVSNCLCLVYDLPSLRPQGVTALLISGGAMNPRAQRCL